MTTTNSTTPSDNSPLAYCEPGLIKPILLKAIQGLGPHPLLSGQAELIFYEGQYLFHWMDDHGHDQLKFVSADQVRAAFADQEIQSGWLPAGVQQWGQSPKGTWIIQWIPAGRYTLTLLGPSMPTQPISVPLPALVFAGVGEKYYVWAAKAEAFSPTMELFRAPLPNLYLDGHVCFGSNQPPSVSSETWAAAWELFIHSPFNGDLGGGKSRRHHGNICHQLCAVQKKQRYPASDLVEETSYGSGAITMQRAIERYILA